MKQISIIIAAVLLPGLAVHVADETAVPTDGLIQQEKRISEDGHAYTEGIAKEIKKDEKEEKKAEKKDEKNDKKEKKEKQESGSEKEENKKGKQEKKEKKGEKDEDDAKKEEEEDDKAKEKDSDDKKKAKTDKKEEDKKEKKAKAEDGDKDTKVVSGTRGESEARLGDKFVNQFKEQAAKSDMKINLLNTVLQEAKSKSKEQITKVEAAKESRANLNLAIIQQVQTMASHKASPEGVGHWTVVGDSTGVGSGKPNTCGDNSATKLAPSNDYGDAIGVACCQTTTGAGSRPDCMKSVSWGDAKLHCEGRGLRLCSVAEIEGGSARGTGCDFDGYLQWTSDTCNMDGSSSPSSPALASSSALAGAKGEEASSPSASSPSAASNASGLTPAPTPRPTPCPTPYPTPCPTPTPTDCTTTTLPQVDDNHGWARKMVAALDNNNMSNLSRFAKGAQKRHRHVNDDDSDYINKNCPRARFDWVMKNALWQCSQILQIGGSVDGLENSRHFEDQGQAQRFISLDPAWSAAEPKEYHLRNLNMMGWSAHIPATIKEFADSDFPTKSDTDCIIDLNAATEMQFQKSGDFDGLMKLAETVNYIVVGGSKSRGSPVNQIQDALGTSDWARADLDLDCSTDIDVLAAKVPPKPDQVQFHVTIFARSNLIDKSAAAEDKDDSYKDYVYQAALDAGDKVSEQAANATKGAAAAATEVAKTAAANDELERTANASSAASSPSASSPSASSPSASSPSARSPSAASPPR